MEERVAPKVIVPDVVGLPFHVGRDVASEAGLALANPDPDGPSIASLAWPGLFFIVHQHPAPGTVLHAWDSVAIEVVEDGDAPDREFVRPRPAPRGDAASATPERESLLDLAGSPADTTRASTTSSDSCATPSRFSADP